MNRPLTDQPSLRKPTKWVDDHSVRLSGCFHHGSERSEFDIRPGSRSRWPAADHCPRGAR